MKNIAKKGIFIVLAITGIAGAAYGVKAVYAGDCANACPASKAHCETEQK